VLRIIHIHEERETGVHAKDHIRCDTRH
jgi:hypothetical protein